MYVNLGLTRGERQPREGAATSPPALLAVRRQHRLEGRQPAAAVALDGALVDAELASPSRARTARASARSTTHLALDRGQRLERVEEQPTRPRRVVVGVGVAAARRRAGRRWRALDDGRVGRRRDVGRLLPGSGAMSRARRVSVTSTTAPRRLVPSRRRARAPAAAYARAGDAATCRSGRATGRRRGSARRRRRDAWTRGTSARSRGRVPLRRASASSSCAQSMLGAHAPFPPRGECSHPWRRRERRAPRLSPAGQVVQTTASARRRGLAGSH